MNKQNKETPSKVLEQYEKGMISAYNNLGSSLKLRIENGTKTNLNVL